MTMTKAKGSSVGSGNYCSLLIAAAIFCGAYAAQAEGATFSSGMYLQGGLIAQWDGIDNVGAGTHNPDAKTWKDLVGTRDLALVSGKAAFADGNALECLSRSAGYATGPAAACPDYKTIEIVCTQKTGSDIAVVFSAGSGPRAILSKGASFAGTMDMTKYYGWSGNPATLAVTYDGNSPSNYYENATLLTATSTTDSWGYGNLEGLCVGGRVSDEAHPYIGKVYAIRLYDRVLSQSELAMNAAIDAVRFFGAAIESIDLPAMATAGTRRTAKLKSASGLPPQADPYPLPKSGRLSGSRLNSSLRRNRAVPLQNGLDAPRGRCIPPTRLPRVSTRMPR